MSGLGIFASLIFIYAVFEQIVRLKARKSADDLSQTTCLMWVVGLGIFTGLSFHTNAHWIIKWNYLINTVLYIYLWWLVMKYQIQYKMPVSKHHFKVFQGGKAAEKKEKK